MCRCRECENMIHCSSGQKVRIKTQQSTYPSIVEVSSFSITFFSGGDISFGLLIYEKNWNCHDEYRSEKSEIKYWLWCILGCHPTLYNALSAILQRLLTQDSLAPIHFRLPIIPNSSYNLVGRTYLNRNTRVTCFRLLA